MISNFNPSMISNTKMISNMKMVSWISVVLVLLVQITNVFSVLDYWSEDYDTAKNCKSEDLIIKIKQNKTQGFCEEEIGDLSDEKVFQNCKLKMAKTLGSLCRSTTVEQAGELLYCKNNQQTVCCSRNYNCTKSWETISGRYVDTAISFLKDQDKYLAEEKKKGYESCHSLNSSLDASICQQDCTKYEESDFAKKCKNDSGYFKCCVRRDKANCHECRFCCTLLMCTLRIEGNETYTAFSTYEMHANTTLQDSKDENENKAKEDFYLPSHMYKQPDYRCLNPDSNEDPTKWGAYNPNQFEKALSKEEQDKVTTYPFDNRFLNFEDPEVLKYMTGKNKTQKWKEVFGYDFASIQGDSGDVIKNCIKAESSKFAKRCKKRGGLFKCCVAKWDLETYNSARKELKELKLIKSYDEEVCKNDTCFITTNSHICSRRDHYTALVSTEFKSPLENPLGGATIHESLIDYHIESNSTDLRLGYRGTFCQFLDTCAPAALTFEEIGRFMHSYDKESFCNLKHKNVLSDKKYKSNETMEECEKRKFSNIRVCPQKIFESKDQDEEDPSFKLYESAMHKLWEKKSKKKKKDDKSKKKGQDETNEKIDKQVINNRMEMFKDKSVEIDKQSKEKVKKNKKKHKKGKKDKKKKGSKKKIKDKKQEKKKEKKEKERDYNQLIAAFIESITENVLLNNKN